ncbi:MAG: Fe-Mn family superoxide dismutase [Verrucomicrobiales bacterium]|jgi:Fe-Mn family superoxide dismutase
MSFDLPTLTYDSAALEPVIDRQTMELHHGKHHAAYVSKLNDALSGTDWEERPIEEILRRLDALPENVQTSVRQNGGGHFNHRLFWAIMAPGEHANAVEAGLEAAIRDGFGSIDTLKERFTEAAMSRFGSGWAWLCLAPDETLHVSSTANQDTPFMPQPHGGLGNQYQPILGLDVWSTPTT